jgi:hypothetical protein
MKKGSLCTICLKSDIMVLDDIINNSQNDEYERLWVLVRLNKHKTKELFFRTSG